MTVCQTCGDEGFSKLLIPCEQCHNVVVHRYCVDGPSNIDDDEVCWSCEDCVPRIPPPVSAIRKSERICSISDREVQRRKARRNWRNNSSVSKVEESNCVVGKGADNLDDDESNLDENKDGMVRRKKGDLKENVIVSKNERNHSNASHAEKTNVEKGANNVVDNSSNLDEKEIGISTTKGRNHLRVSIVDKQICLGLKAIVVGDDSSDLYKKKKRIVKRKQGKLEENGVASNNRGSEPDLQTRRKAMGLNSKDAENKNVSESSLLKGQKTEDLNLSVKGKDMQKKLEMNMDPQLSNGPEYCLEGTFKADEIIDGDSVEEKLHKHGQSFSELHSSLLEEQLKIGNSEAAKQPDSAEEKVSDNIQATKAVAVSHQRNEKQSGFSVYELQTPRKKRRLVIAMEYSDSDEEPNYVRRERNQVVPDAVKSYCDTSSGEPLVKKGECSLTQESFLKSDDSFPTRQSPTQTDNHMLTQTSSIGCKNHDIPQLPPAILDYYIPAQPMIDAVWRGHCSISNHKYLSFGLEARLSNKAHAFVHGAASALPNLLHFEIMQKQYAWPKRFQDSPPTGDAIGLYFFPIEERDEKSYTLLLDEMIDSDLALKFYINNLELLVYCSLELPLEERRFQSKYYMWGVFKRKQETSSTSQPSDNRTSDTKYDRKGSFVPGINRSPLSPSSVNNHSVINSSNSHLHHKVWNRVELTPSIMLKHPKPAKASQAS